MHAHDMACGLRQAPLLSPYAERGPPGSREARDRLRWRCGGRGGRFPATPLLFENAVYARWLEAAREALHGDHLSIRGALRKWNGPEAGREVVEAGRESVEAGGQPLEAGRLVAVVSQSAVFGAAFKLEARALGHEALAEPGLWAAPSRCAPSAGRAPAALATHGRAPLRGECRVRWGRRGGGGPEAAC